MFWNAQNGQNAAPGGLEKRLHRCTHNEEIRVQTLPAKCEESTVWMCVSPTWSVHSVLSPTRASGEAEPPPKSWMRRHGKGHAPNLTSWLSTHKYTFVGISPCQDLPTGEPGTVTEELQALNASQRLEFHWRYEEGRGGGRNLMREEEVGGEMREEEEGGGGGGGRGRRGKKEERGRRKKRRREEMHMCVKSMAPITLGNPLKRPTTVYFTGNTANASGGFCRSTTRCVN
ncbi:hypothetical protein EYF80_043690 [Liparis tanakae]|uniref:Uncharacterized protein n=1 Tax=Liparis tanakae TaxID=230148 RepID=A0A4Z2FZQ0_9TELE|nr:hypothetical protein EYF80_043690 [Liparis tanakae]